MQSHIANFRYYRTSSRTLQQLTENLASYVNMFRAILMSQSIASNLVEKPFNCFSYFHRLTIKTSYGHLECLRMHSQEHGVKCNRYVTSVFWECIISCLHIICTPLIPLSLISSVCSVYVPFTITDSQPDDNCNKRLTTDVNTKTCIKLQME